MMSSRLLQLAVAIFLVTSTLLVSTATANPAIASQEGPVWFWFGTCSGTALKLEVKFDQKLVYQSSFPICHSERANIPDIISKKELDFVFRSPRAITWEGYRDVDNITGPNQKLYGQIWLAGSDPDDLVLGIAFTSGKDIYMNTIHVAYPNRKAGTEIETGLVVITEPVAESSSPQKRGPSDFKVLKTKNTGFPLPRE